MTTKAQAQRDALRSSRVLDDAHDLSAFTPADPVTLHKPEPAAPPPGPDANTQERKSAKTQPRKGAALFNKTVRLSMDELRLLTAESQRRRKENGGSVRGKEAGENVADTSALIREAIQKTFGGR